MGPGEALVDLLHLWIRESYPYFSYFPGCEERWQEMYGCTQKSHIIQTLCFSFFSACPHTGSLYVDAYEIFVGIESAHSYGILTFATTEFEHYWIVVAEHFFSPMAS